MHVHLCWKQSNPEQNNLAPISRGKDIAYPRYAFRIRCMDEKNLKVNEKRIKPAETVQKNGKNVKTWVVSWVRN